MKNSKRTYQKRNTKNSSPAEVPLKDRPLGEKIVIGLCICILTVFPFIFIVVSLSVAIYIGVSEKIAEVEHHEEKRESNEDLYGKYLYLDEIDEDVYVVVSENDDPEKRLVWDKDFCGYYDDRSDGYVWYDKKREQWKYWFKGISSDYKDFGWMVYKPNGWRIEREYGDWIKLPEEYDRSRLWYIKQEE